MPDRLSCFLFNCEQSRFVSLKKAATLVLISILAALSIAPTSAMAQTASPGFVYALAARGTQVIINWEPTVTSGAITYYVYRAAGATIPSFPGAAWTEITGGACTGQFNSSWVDEDVKANSSQYWYVVTAKVSTDTESVASPVNNGLAANYLPTTTATSYQWYIGTTTLPPLEPTGVELSGADVTITMSWDAVPSTNIDHYNVYRSELSGVTGELVGVVDAPTTTFDDTDTNPLPTEPLEKFHHYWYRVEAVDDQGGVGYKSIERHYRTVSSADLDAPHGGASTPQVGADTCMVCHDPHCAEAPKLLCSPTEIGEPELCLSCHDGTGSRYDIRFEFTEHALSSHEVTITAGDGSTVIAGGFTCVDCHTPHGDPEAVGSFKLLYVDGVKSGNGVCYGSGCHGATNSDHWAGDMSAFDDSDHNTAIPDPASGTEVKCSTCHMPHASPNEALWTSAEYRACLVCHSGENVSLSSPDIYMRMTANEDHDSHHDVLARDQVVNGTYIACQNCHNTHLVTTDNPLVDPDDPSMAGQLADGPNDPMSVANGAATAPKYNSFCFSCHDGTLPTAVQTGGWVDPPDDNGLLPTAAGQTLADLFVLNNHGAAVSKAPVLDPAVGYVRGDTLSCMSCHEPHGTINNYNLRSDVVADDGTSPRTNRLLVRVVDASGNETGYFDTRFFCFSCHVQTTASPQGHLSGTAAKDLNMFPNNCTDKACHQHGSTSRRF